MKFSVEGSFITNKVDIGREIVKMRQGFGSVKLKTTSLMVGQPKSDDRWPRREGIKCRKDELFYSVYSILGFQGNPKEREKSENEVHP